MFPAGDVNVYLSSGTGYSYDYTYSLCCFSNLSTHGWLVGSFDGGPRESLLHMFPYSGGLTMVVYGLP